MPTLTRTMLMATSLVLLAASPAAAESKPGWKGKVVSVADGDTVTVLKGKEQIRIRLDGVDTPEKRQAFGDKAKKFTANMVAGKVVRVVPATTDRYGRTVAKIYLDGKCLNEALVQAGLAWWYRKYAKGNKVLAGLETKARKARKGLWKDPKPTPPWDWRRQQRGKGPATATATTTATATRGHGTGSLHGNVKSHALHGPGCQHYNCKNCTALFKTVAQARSAGYRPHNACLPTAH